MLKKFLGKGKKEEDGQAEEDAVSETGPEDLQEPEDDISRPEDSDDGGSQDDSSAEEQEASSAAGAETSENEEGSSDEGEEKEVVDDSDNSGEEEEGEEVVDHDNNMLDLHHDVLGGQEADDAELNIHSLGEFCLTEVAAEAVTGMWKTFLTQCESVEVAAELLYNSIYEGIPSLQPLFTSPATIQARKLYDALDSFVRNLNNPAELKMIVEALGFSHMQIEVSVPRAVMFRDAILDLLAVELGDQASTLAVDSWKAVLNYICGAIIYVRAKFSERINTLLQTWEAVNKKGHKAEKAVMGGSAGGGSNQNTALRQTAKGEEVGSDKAKGTAQNQVPTTYSEMFRFNAAVMGFGSSAWMHEVLEAFDRIVRNVANPSRLQEECEVLMLRITRVKRKGNVNFGEYKSCMLASLRSLLPKDWSSDHEVAWTWLWENVERLLQKNITKPQKWEPALAKWLKELDENTAFEMRRSIYALFFSIAPAGQDHFKQSNTYLHFIADKIMRMTLEMFKDPVKQVDELSATGLRHVGYGIPTELFAPFTSACIETVSGHISDQVALEAYSWSMALMSRITARTIMEGSTIVMKAININSAKQLRKALAVAPRCERAQWVLMVTVGTQSISPLAWALQSGSLEAAQAVLADLLTIRADRDRYYFGAEELFNRHPDVIKMLCDNAPGLLPDVLTGLVWRSRSVENAKRRANYYIKYLLVDNEGKIHRTMEWIAKFKNPKIVCHDMMIFLSDLVWSRVAMGYFLMRKIWFFFTLLLFIFSQSIMENIRREVGDVIYVRIAIFSCRAFIYAFSMTQLFYSHAAKTWKNFRTKETVQLWRCIRLPTYIQSWQEMASFCLLLALLAMMSTEPIFWCINHNEGKIFYEDCEEAKLLRAKYEVISMMAMFLYFALLIDLTVLSTKVSAYVLVSIRMLSELGLFLLALTGTMLAGSCSLSAVRQQQEDFHGVHLGVLALFEMLLGITKGEQYESYEEDAVVMFGIFLFIIAAVFFLLNMLIAQLTCAYESVYSDMVGYARLERIEIIVTTVPSVSEKRWSRFVDSLKLESPIEFGKGDVGIAGGIQILEPANLHPTTKETVRRHGGSNSVEMPWPEEDHDENADEERLDRLETLLKAAMKRVAKDASGRRRDKTGSTTGGTSAYGSVMKGGTISSHGSTVSD
mmetsp:Transcript_51511/g.122492  ORF Transcript_51511/g.122492 Transcript_51511/m.122492 type:complete len:1163 (+) Transcript_51511:75-3563(+)